MKTISNSLILLLTFQLGVSALPDDAKREIKRLQDFELKARQKVEKEIIQEKKDAIKKLKRLSKSIKKDKHMWIKNLADLQIGRYEAEIEKSLVAISGRKPNKNKPKDLPDLSKETIQKAAKIISFGDTYQYKHPQDKYKQQICEITLDKDGTAHVTHSENERIMFDKMWTWTLDNNRIKIAADHSHGPIYITRRGIREIFVNYTGKINNKVSAKVK